MRKSPCYKCEVRSDDCHGKCKTYKKWREQLNEQKVDERVWRAYLHERDFRFVRKHQ